jgi:hypothetical protein
MPAVRLTVMPNRLEAEQLCSLLGLEGIECFCRSTDVSVGAADGLGAAWFTEVWVDEADLERAREMLGEPA